MKKPIIGIVLIVLATALAIGGLQIYRYYTIVRYVDDPHIGDVFAVTLTHNDIGKRYYYIKLASINGDTLFMYPAMGSYEEKYDMLHEDDYLLKDSVMFYNRPGLRGMYDDGMVISAYRNYPAYTGFSRER